MDDVELLNTVVQENSSEKEELRTSIKSLEARIIDYREEEECARVNAEELQAKVGLAPLFNLMSSS